MKRLFILLAFVATTTLFYACEKDETYDQELIKQADSTPQSIAISKDEIIVPPVL